MSIFNFCNKFVIYLTRWRSYKILSCVPKEEWPQLRIKVAAASVLKNKRAEWGQNRRWLGDYMTNLNENPVYNLYNATVHNLKNTDRFSTVMFSCTVRKFNR